MQVDIQKFSGTEPNTQECCTERITNELSRCLENNSICKYGLAAGSGSSYCLHPEHRVLAVPPEACVIVIGSWIIKTDYFFKPLEVISPKNDSWWVTWKDFHSPLDVSNNNWSFKLKTKGLKQIVAAISYHF